MHNQNIFYNIKIYSFTKPYSVIILPNCHVNNVWNEWLIEKLTRLTFLLLPFYVLLHEALIKLAGIMELIIKPLACQINCCLLNFSPASIFKVLQCCSKLVKCCLSIKQLGSGWDAKFTRHLIWIQAVYIWHYSCNRRFKG